MSDNIFKIKNEIEQYINRNENFLSKFFSCVGAPFEFVFEKVIPEKAMQVMQTTLIGALGLITDAAQYVYSIDSIYNNFKVQGANVKSLSDIKNSSFETCDKIAQSFIGSNKLIAALEGGGMGLGGLVLMAADIPTLMTINFRMMSQIANSMGYDTTSEIEKVFLMNIISLANAQQGAKISVWAELNKISAAVLRKKSWDKLEEFMLVKVIQEIAEKLGVNLTKRKLAQMVPIIGGGIGAGMNYVFTRDNGIAALMAYRRRRLDEMNL